MNDLTDRVLPVTIAVCAALGLDNNTTNTQETQK